MSEVSLLRGLAAATSAPIDASTDDDEPRTAFAIFSAVASNVLLFVLVFGLSATVQFQTLRREFENKKALLFGLAVQFLLMPLLGYLAVWSMSATAAGFTEAMGLTLLVLTASPAGSFSNWWCSMFNAELALSVAMTTISSVLSVGFLPANLFLYTHLVSDDCE
jgi:predicted Na+-dependent transporter